MKEATIIINGVLLKDSQSMFVRMALAHDLQAARELMISESQLICRRELSELLRIISGTKQWSENVLRVNWNFPGPLERHRGLKPKPKRKRKRKPKLMGFLGNLANSRYLKKEDAMPTPILLTIAEIKQENVAMDNEPPKMKQVAYFKETDKGFVIGKVTGMQIASFLGDPGDTPVAWYGKQIVLYCEPNVMMKGKVVGGLRVRAPRGAAAAAAANQQTTFRQPVQTGAPKPPPQEEEDNVPY